MSEARILTGDALTMLRTLPSESVHCCVTSPPYWGLRDYGVDGQLGLEETPEEYVEDMVSVFREVRRVLRGDGTLWLNLGDSYAGSWGAQGRNGSMANRSVVSARQIEAHPKKVSGTGSTVGLALKPKDLVGIPWRVAFALQADGWWLRSDVIWSKPNPMPESVKDRPTKSHEYVFLLSKSERYYYDAYAVAEESVSDHPSGNGYKRPEQLSRGGRGQDEGWTPTVTRNRRTVWEITTKPYPEAHFAVYPPELVEPCIKAGTSDRGACEECGAPWERVVERPEEPEGLRNRGNGAKMDYHARQTGSGQKLQDWLDENPKETVGWQPTCACDTEGVVPCVVLDPFAGSGTTGMVATGHGRNAVLVDLNPDYAEMMRERIGPMFVTVERE